MSIYQLPRDLSLERRLRAPNTSDERERERGGEGRVSETVGNEMEAKRKRESLTSHLEDPMYGASSRDYG